MRTGFETTIQALENAELLSACAALVQHGIKRAGLELSPEVQRGVIARGVEYMIDAGVTWDGEVLRLPTHH